MMRLVAFAASVSLVLSGCSQDDAQTSEAYGAAREPTRPDAVAPTPTPTATSATAIPANFLGIWDYVNGSCDPASDLRVDIGPRAIDFYESHGEVTKVTVESADSIVVDLAMQGEGETWTMATRYSLSDGGKTLTPTDAKGGSGEPMPLKKCPAEAAR